MQLHRAQHQLHGGPPFPLRDRHRHSPAVDRNRIRRARTLSTGRSRWPTLWASNAMRYKRGPIAERCGADFRLGSVESVDGDSRRAWTHDGEEVPLRPPDRRLRVAVAGRVSGAVTFWGAADDGRVQEVVRGLRERAGGPVACRAGDRSHRRRHPGQVRRWGASAAGPAKDPWPFRQGGAVRRRRPPT